MSYTRLVRNSLLAAVALVSAASFAPNASAIALIQILRPQPALLVTVKSQTVTDITVANQKNISLIRFEARAGLQSVLLTDLRFNAQAGTLANGQNYTVWVDTNGDAIVDTILQKGVAAQNNQITFDKLVGGGYVINAMQTVLFEVHADVVSTLVTPKSLQLQFATTLPDYVEAENLLTGVSYLGINTNGVCLSTCTIYVKTVPSTVWFFVNQGYLYVSKSTTQLRNRQLLGGTLADEVLRLNFRAEIEAIDVTKLVFTAVGANASSTSTNVERLELYKVGSFTPLAIATVAACGTASVPANSMCVVMQNQQLVVNKGSITSILVRPRMRTDVDGTISGHEVTFTIVANSNPTNGSVAARGLHSGNNLLQNNNDTTADGEVFIGVTTPAAGADIVGKKNVVVLSKVTSMLNANPDANGTTVPTGTQRPFGQFKVSAAPHTNIKNGLNKVTLDGLIFNVNATNVAMNAADFKFYNKNNPVFKAVCVAKNSAGATLTGEISGLFLVECSGLSTSSVSTEIDAGTDMTIVLEGHITNPKITMAPSTLQASLQSFTDIAASIFGIPASHMKWLDKDSGASTTFLWIDYTETLVNSTLYQG